LALPLHRCLQRHGSSRLPDVDGDLLAKKKFKSYPIGFFHIDIAEVQTAEGRLYLFVAIDRTSKFAVVELYRKALRKTAADFLRHLVEAVPYKINIVLTNNGTHFTTPGAGGSAAAPSVEGLAKGEPVWAHAFEYACATLGIEHRTSKPKHPWTNGQIERMNRTITDGEADQKTIRGIVFPRNVKRFHSDDHDQLERHLADFISAYNFGRRLKTLKGLTPYEFICKCWTSEPEKLSSTHSTKCQG